MYVFVCCILFSMMNESSAESISNSDYKREKICISISEGCIRHHNEEPELEEQFIMRLPEREAKIVQEALENDTLENRLSIRMQKNQRDALVTLDNQQLHGRVMDLPTITESYKLADESTLYKTGDISQILICSSAENHHQSSEIDKKTPSSSKSSDYKYSNGLCPPLKNARKKRFRNVQLAENFDPNVDRAVKLLLRADGAAESVNFEIAYENNKKDEQDTDDVSSVLSASNEVDVFGETLSVSSSSSLPSEDLLMKDSTDSDSKSDSSLDSDVENYDFRSLTEEQKQHLAHLKEINWCLSNCDFKVSPSRPSSSIRGRGQGQGQGRGPGPGPGRGQGRGRPRIHGTITRTYKTISTNPTMSRAGRGGRGRPPGRSRARI